MSKNTNKTIKLLAIKKVVNTNKVKFDTFKTKMLLVVKGEEEKGLQEKWVDLKFRQEVKNRPTKTSILVCDEYKVDPPSTYQIVKDKETGKDIYPVCWVREIKEIKEVKRKASQDAFIVDEEDDEELEVEDGE